MKGGKDLMTRQFWLHNKVPLYYTLVPPKNPNYLITGGHPGQITHHVNEKCLKISKIKYAMSRHPRIMFFSLKKRKSWEYFVPYKKAVQHCRLPATNPQQKNPSTYCVLLLMLPQVHIEGMTTYPHKSTHQTIRELQQHSRHFAAKHRGGINSPRQQDDESFCRS